MLRGIDVSHYQGSVDWATLKARYGLSWGAAKATEGVSYRDSQFGANWRKMKAAGLVRMAYHFAHPGGDPAAEAKAFLSVVKAQGLEAADILVMDMESNPNKLPMLTLRDWLAGWADYVTKATGRKPFLYTGSGYITNNATKGLRPHYAAWWFPKYPSAYDGKTAWPGSITGYPVANNWGGPPDIWQFTQSFRGYAGNTDASVANMTLADLKIRGRIDTPSTPAKPPVKPPTSTTTEGNDMGTWTEAQLRAMMQAENEEYAIRFWIDPTGTGTALRGQVTYILNQQAVIQNKLDTLLAEHSGAPAPALADAQAQVADLHAQMDTAVSQLQDRPMASQLADVLSADATESAPDAGTAAETGQDGSEQ